MDGVIVDWEKQFERYSGGLSPKTYRAEHGCEQSYKFVHKNSPAFYATAPWMKDGKILYNFLKELPTEILSHSTDLESDDGKKQWLAKNNISFKQNLVSHREDKTKFAAPDAIIIDDRQDVINDFNTAGGIGVLHTSATDTINKLKEILGVKEKYRVYNSILNPEIWEDDILKPEVLDQLLKTATAFYKNTELTAPIEDILFLGSTAGYNWTPTSDIDLHILINFDKIDPNKELVKKLVDAYKNKWNEHHDIHINEHTVEVYIQDINEVNRSHAVYSVLNNQWVKKPKPEAVEIDKDTIKKKYKQFVDEIDNIINKGKLDDLNAIAKRLYSMRETGLSTGGEFSPENLVFKLLRASGYISKLRATINNLIDIDINELPTR